MPELFLICGMVCSGKTTLAHKLAHAHDAVRLGPDEWLVELVGNKTDRAQLDRLRSPVERLQWQVVQTLLLRGVNVVSELGIWRRSERQQCLTEARSWGARVTLHYLDVPRSVLLERIAWRNQHGGPADIRIDNVAELDTWLSWFEPPTTAELNQFDAAVIHRWEGTSDDE